jgi:D-alanyl-D-alanine carboxypeptidase/D-alanyl-D-alanine-endopeptidase (penicillin-binding protein 4)
MAQVRRRIAVSVAAALLAALVAVSGAGAAHGQLPLDRRLAKALTVPHVSPARSAALAVDLSTGKVLYGRNQSLSLAPASNEKLALTYGLLKTLGPTFRIDTEVLGEGQLQGTVWNGDLVLRGYGDPSLSTADLRLLAQQVRAQGIRRVSGSVRGDESYFDARRTVSGWKASFYGDESPPISALVVDRDRPFGVLAREPALAAATVFRKTLKAAGVAVTAPPTVGSVAEFSMPLASVSSPTLATLIRYMDRESDNFTAEMLLKALGAAQSDRGTSAAGAVVVTTALSDAGIPLAGVRIVDGSGLSRLDRLTAGALVGILQASWANPDIRPFVVAALPVAGVNGTLEDRMRRAPARGNVLAKTGTTSDASALSGYVKSRYVFAVLQNGRPLSYWWARVAQDRFATVLASAAT